jgi:hypothetical protein
LKRSRRKKVLGLAIGDRSILAAEVVAGERPDVTQIGELIYPEGVSPSTPELLGKLLGDFLRAGWSFGPRRFHLPTLRPLPECCAWLPRRIFPLI